MEWLGSEPSEPLRRTGRCLSYGHGITYWPLGEVPKEHLGILESDPPETILRRLESREILGLTLGLDVGGGLHPLAARDRLHEEWVDFVAELSSKQPAVILIEDLHWAEDELLDLQERVLRDARGPVFLLGTARPELLDRRPAWGGGRRNASLLWLEPVRIGRRALGRGGAHAGAATPPARGRPRACRRQSVLRRGAARQPHRHGRARAGGRLWRARELPAGFKVPDSSRR